MGKCSIWQWRKYKALPLHDLQIAEGVTKQIYNCLRKKQNGADQPWQDK